MPVDFNDYFWGEKHSGFDVLYHNMKFGLVASKELAEFLREKASNEEQNSKMMLKLAHKASLGTLNSTFAPIWTILRTSAERISSLHSQMVQKLTELVKDVAKYADELHRKHKIVKDDECQTLECVQAIQASSTAVQKSRDVYTSKVLELEKLKKENGSQKDIEKVEMKLKKMQEDYKILLEKHNPIKMNFEKRMSQTCRRFQEIEEIHLRQMKEFLSTYLEMLQNNHDMVGQVHSDFKRQFLDMTVDKLLEQFVLNKYTGLEKADIPQLEFIPLSIDQIKSHSSSRINQQSAIVTSNSVSSIAAVSAERKDLLDPEALPMESVNCQPSSFTIKSEATHTNPTSTPEQNNASSSVATSALTSPSPAYSSQTASVKVNFRSWFSSNKQQLPHGTDTKKYSSSGGANLNNSFGIVNNNKNTNLNYSANSNILNSITSSRETPSSPSKSQQQSQEQESYASTAQDNSNRKIDNQVSGILRSRRDKTKSKKGKKKKDGESIENIQEEGLSSHLADTALVGIDEISSKLQNIDKTSESAVPLPSSETVEIENSFVTNSLVKKNHSVVNTNDVTSIQFNSTDKINTSLNVPSTACDNANIGGYGSLEVDEDGYSVQPNKANAWQENNDNASFYTDSDSDSETEKLDRKIHVKIKPLNNGQAPMSASVDELRATVENISLSPTGVFSHSQQIQQMSLQSRQQSPEISNASTPTASVHPYAPLQSPTLSMTNNSRYTDLGDIFSEIGDGTVSAPSSASLNKAYNRQISTPSNSIAIPRPPSRRSEMINTSITSPSVTNGCTVVNAPAARERMSPQSIMKRAESSNSLEFRSALANISSSRGPSPLTVGITGPIPLAVAFHEAIHACFKGSDESRCKVKITGDVMLSFPAGIVGLLANNPNPAKLSFFLKNIQNIEHILPNTKLIQMDNSHSRTLYTVLNFNMTSLGNLLKRQAELHPTAAYYNVDILKYHVRTKPGASSCPFQLVSYWKCEPTFTALKIDYKYNCHAMTNQSPLLNVTVSVPVNGSVRNVQSKPHSAWLGESNRLVWNFTDISQNSPDGGIGTLRARLELNDGPSTPSVVTTQFNCEGSTLSGLEFELHGSGYRLSLVKQRFVAGKYFCEGDGIRSTITPTPPSIS